MTLQDIDTMGDNDYDTHLIQIVKDIESRCYGKLVQEGRLTTGRVEYLRVKQWTKRICEESSLRCLDNHSLLRNRNQYAKLLWKCVVII